MPGSSWCIAGDAARVTDRRDVVDTGFRPGNSAGGTSAFIGGDSKATHFGLRDDERIGSVTPRLEVEVVHQCTATFLHLNRRKDDAIAAFLHPLKDLLALLAELVVDGLADDDLSGCPSVVEEGPEALH